MVLEGNFGDFQGGFSVQIDTTFDENTEKTQG